MKFLANMGISPVTVAFLRQAGHDALHLHEAGLDSLTDPVIIQKARAESRVPEDHIRIRHLPLD